MYSALLLVHATGAGLTGAACLHANKEYCKCIAVYRSLFTDGATAVTAAIAVAIKAAIKSPARMQPKTHSKKHHCSRPK